MLVAVPLGFAVARDSNRIAAFMKGAWPPWVSHLENVAQIASPAIALLAVWLNRVVQSRSTESGIGGAARLLGLLAMLPPAGDRERFVCEVLANMADMRWRQRVGELLSVAAAVPGLAVIMRWARRRRA